MALDLVGGSTSNEALDARAGATDHARASGGKNSPLTTDRARAATGKKSKIIEVGAIDLTGARDNKFGTDFSANKGTLTVNNGIDPQSAFANSTALANAFSTTVKDLGDKQSALLETVLNSQSAPAQETAGSNVPPTSDTTADTPQTAEEKAAAKAKRIKWMLILGGLGAWFYFRK